MNRTFLSIIIIIILKISTTQLCEESKNYCSKCNPLTAQCIICSKEDILIPDEKGGCVGSKKCMIGKNYCLECNLEEKLCQTCDEGYYPDENGGCSYSNNCKISYKGECLECNENFILVEKNKICKSKLNDDFKNCQEINAKIGLCKVCEEGYYLNKGDQKCTKIENCFESMFGKCLSCIKGFYLDKKENKCKEKNDKFMLCKQTIDGENCDICDSGNYFDEKGNCVQTNFCSKSKNGRCEECIEGYYLSSNNNNCVNSNNCYIGDKDTGLCIECNMFNYINLKDYKCKSNIEDEEYKYCQKVANYICVKCESGYFLGKDNKCTFTDNCEESENGKCILCSEGYNLGKDNFCSNVEHCIYSRFNFCRECEDGYYYSTVDQKCLETEGIKNLENCKYTCVNPDGTRCCECKKNYYLNSNSLCVENNEEGPLYKCRFADKNNTCWKCIDGFYLGSEDKKCSLIENCKKSENENICLECDEYYCLDSNKGKCIRNDFLYDVNKIFYFACKKTNEKGTQCEECIEGYELNENGFCYSFENCAATNTYIDENGPLGPEECEQCEDIQSKKGYYYCANKYFGCIEGHFEHCLKCDNLANLYDCTK